MLLTNSAGSVRLYTVIHSRSELQCILPIERIIQDGGRLVVFIFIIARQRSSDGRQVRLIGTRPKASRAIEFAINRPTTSREFHTLGPVYLIDCFPKEMVLDGGRGLLPVTWGQAVVFARYTGFLHYLQLASHELATIGISVTKNEIPNIWRKY